MHGHTFLQHLQLRERRAAVGIPVAFLLRTDEVSSEPPSLLKRSRLGIRQAARWLRAGSAAEPDMEACQQPFSCVSVELPICVGNGHHEEEVMMKALEETLVLDLEGFGKHTHLELCYNHTTWYETYSAALTYLEPSLMQCFLYAEPNLTSQYGSTMMYFFFFIVDQCLPSQNFKT